MIGAKSGFNRKLSAALRAAGLPAEKAGEVIARLTMREAGVHITRKMKAEIEKRLAYDGLVCLKMLKNGKGAEIVSAQFVTIAPRRHFELHKVRGGKAAKKKQKRTVTPKMLAACRANAIKARAAKNAKAVKA